MDVVGKKFGRWNVLSTADRLKYLCECECGTRKIVDRQDLIRKDKKRTKSCGCYAKELSTTHGMSNTNFYRLWRNMISRCTNPNVDNYKHYGGRGIKVCKRWIKFENFYADMGERPEGTTLDRINNNGDYKPSNCKWATKEEQDNNKRSSRFLEYKGERKTLNQWAKLHSIASSTLARRLGLGWTINKALTEKVREFNK